MQGLGKEGSILVPILLVVLSGIRTDKSMCPSFLLDGRY